MTTKTILASAISTALLAAAMPTQAASVTEFVKEGDVIAQFRIRNETVQQDNAKDDAIAMTARARLGYETASMAGFKILAEFDQVIALQDEYGQHPKTAIGPGADNTSVVADPAAGDINRAQVSYKSDAFGATLGRQRIIFDNARFIGNVGWRQNEQTFDAARIDLTAVDNLTATYAYISQRNNILYHDVEVKDHLLNVGYKTPFGKVSGYGYLLENADSEATFDTFGLRFKGKTALDALDILYTAEYATQTQNSGADGAKDNDAAYTLLEGGIKVSGITLAAGMETLGGDGTYGFSTPYATGHAFNGWSDQFLGTPANGLSDTYAKVVTKVAGVKLLAMYHDFSTDKDGDDLGSEINLLAAKKFDKNFSAGIKYAQYSAGDDAYAYVDTDKLWVWAEAKF
jgi:hypothetical protein